MRARNYKKKAKAALKGRYWWTLLAALIAWIFGIVSFGSGADKLAETAESAGGSVLYDGSVLATFIDEIGNTFNIYDLSDKLIAFLKVNSVGFIIAALVLAIIGAAITLGYRLFNIELYKTTEKPSIGIMFDRLNIIGKAFFLGLRIAIRVIFGFILLFIPGIIAIYKYFAAEYILAQHPEYSTKEALQKSRELMRGRKWKKFCLDFSFIGWDFLAAIVPGGMVFLTPFKEAADAAFYLNSIGAFDAAEVSSAAPAEVQ